jgi:hypothetical protein
MHNNLLRTIIRKLLCEGGAYGHLSHLYEAHDMTFGELLQILNAASEGKLENVTEKTDGINMFFTVANSELKVATNSGFIRTGGMNRNDLMTRFSEKPSVQSAYVSGYDALAKAISNLSDKMLKHYFGDKNRQVWYSIEVITTGLAMTINYGKNILAIHLNGSKAILADGTEEDSDHTIAMDLGNKLQSIGSGEWDVHAPAMIELPQMSKEAFNNAAGRIRSLGVSDSDTIQDFLAKSAKEALAANGLRQQNVLDAASKKMAGFPGQPNLTTFKKQVPSQAYALMQNTKEWAKEAILPLEDIITDFAVERLRGVDSALMDNSQSEVQRLRSLVEKAIQAIESSGDENAMSVLQREMVKLKSAENIVTPMEGIVFHHNGRILKLTGAFSSFHKILSLFTFGKGGSKLSMEHKNLLEGGHALSGMQPVPLKAFSNEYANLVNFLKQLGANNIVPLGSTGKKELMGDIDLGIETDISIEDFQKRLEDAIGTDKVTRNVTVVSFAHDFEGIVGQVDLMFGNTKYLSWSRAGTDPRKTPFKGVARNLLLNILAKTLSEMVFEKESNDVLKKRYIVDMDKGLFVNTQTKQSKDGKPLKDWKNVDRKFVTDVPQEIVSVLLGEDFTVEDTLTFDDLVSAIKRSKLINKQANAIVRQFVDSIRNTATKRPDILGPRTLELMDQVEREYLN